jgi:hypothetical protein
MWVWILGGALLIGIVIGAFILRSVIKGAPSLAVNEGRRYWAFLAVLGGCITFTILAAVGVYLVSDNPKYSLYLALAAHFQIFVGMSTFGFVLGRRMRGKAGKSGLEWDDSAEEPRTPAEGAAAAAGAAEKVAQELDQQETKG